MTKFEEEFDNNVEIFDVIGNHNSMCCEVDQVKEVFKDWQPQQSLPVVPEFVGEWIDKNISVAHNAELMIHNILICAIDNKNRYLFPLEVEKFVLKNPITFLNAVITGKYQVEKPQLFYLKHIDMSKRDKDHDYFAQIRNDRFEHDSVKSDTLPQPEIVGVRFTQQEIDSMQTGSYERIEVVE